MELELRWQKIDRKQITFTVMNGQNTILPVEKTKTNDSWLGNENGWSVWDSVYFDSSSHIFVLFCQNILA
jgi:hypothetical protein